MKKISSNRPLRSSSGGSASTWFAVATTKTGTATATTISGTSTLAQPPAPIERSQPNSGSSKADSSSDARTPATAGSQ